MNKEAGNQESDRDRPIRSLPDFLNQFKDYLKKRGHSQFTQHAYLPPVKHFIRWLQTKSPSQRKVTSKAVRLFLQECISACYYDESDFKNIKTVRAALNQILLMEGQERFRPIIKRVSPKIETALNQFDTYLRNVHGHCENTRWYHRRHTRMFLSWLFNNHFIELSRITGENLCHFVKDMANNYRPGSIKVLVYSLRTYLKFLQFNGHTTPSLAATIPKPANWSGGNLPQALNSRELTSFWSVFDRSTAIGKRDYAMARCMIDLGLRCSEVANIQLDSIDWHDWILRLTQTKNRRKETLPIPATMGQALVAYLRHGRPKTSKRAVFVYHRAPLGKAVTNCTVRGAIRRAFSRAGLPWTGTHVLRKTVVSRMFEGNASLKEIADVMRHSSIDTTKSYTKIDLSHLAQVALPWPGRIS